MTDLTNTFCLELSIKYAFHLSGIAATSVVIFCTSALVNFWVQPIAIS
jgi:hypothetical protein